MKKLLAIILALCTVLSLAVPMSASDFSPAVALGLFAGDTSNGWGACDTVTVSSSGTYTLRYNGGQTALDWIIIKTATGNQENEPTSIPADTLIQITDLKIDGTSYTFDGGKSTFDFYVGVNGTIEIKPFLTPNFGGTDHIDNNPRSASTIEVTFTIAEAGSTGSFGGLVKLGDLDSDGNVDRDDAVYVLYNSLFGEEQYPLNQDVDFNGDGSVTRDDAVYLLYHSMFPADYPLTNPTKYMKYVRSTMVEKETSGSTVEFSNVDYPTYTHLTYYSTTCKRNRGVNVMLPADYDPNKSYPVLYALHGYWGDEYSLLDETGYAPIWFKQVLGNAVASGEAVEMIVVIPHIFCSETKEYCDGMNGENNAAYDNFINELKNDLMPFIESNYLVKTGRENTAVTGFSMGGRESIYLGLAMSDVFGYVGAVCPAPGVDTDLMNASQMVFANDPYLFFITAGSNDGVVGQVPAGYHNIFNNNGVDHVWHYIDGGTHDGVSIRAHLHNFVRYIFQAK